MTVSEKKLQLIAPGGFLGRHRVLAQLGQGGMAEVFLAVAPGPVGLNKLVVIKRLRDNRQDDEFLGMFLNEAHIAAKLNHPNVIHLYEVEQDDEQLYLVMEYLDGQSLQRLRGHLGIEGQPLALHLRILADALLGLDYAHELGNFDGSPLGIVHRDMSPHNLFVTYEGTTKVLDFGIAKALNQTVHTRVGGIKGKIQFMSPEQARGSDSSVDRRSDIFTVGVLLWEAAAGRRLWKGEDEVVVFQHLVKGDPIPPPSTANPKVHPRLERICMRALQIDREKRYPTAKELHDDLELFMQQAGLRATSLDVGRFVSAQFKQERESFRAMIDAELKNASSASDIISIGGGGPNSGAVTSAGTGSRLSSSMARLAQPPSLPTTELDPRSTTGLASALFRSQVRVWQLVAIGALTAVVGALVWKLNASERVEPRTSAAPTLAVTPATQPTPIAQVHLTVEVSPSHARVFLDGHSLGVGPYKGSQEKSSGKHLLRAEANGYKPTSLEISLESDNTVQLALSPERRNAAQPAADRATPAAPRSVAPAARPASQKKQPVVSIDTENPW